MKTSTQLIISRVSLIITAAIVLAIACMDNTGSSLTTSILGLVGGVSLGTFLAIWDNNSSKHNHWFRRTICIE